MKGYVVEQQLLYCEVKHKNSGLTTETLVCHGNFITSEHARYIIIITQSLIFFAVCIFIVWEDHVADDQS